MDWKILSIDADGDLITQAKYFVRAEDGANVVETEGNWAFLDPKLVVPFADVTESMVIDWIKDQTMRDGANMVESRLSEQLAALKSAHQTAMPWLPQVFTPEL